MKLSHLVVLLVPVLGALLISNAEASVCPTGQIQMNCPGSTPFCAPTGTECCGQGVCTAGLECAQCPGLQPTCVLPPATCCQGLVCGGGTSCATCPGTGTTCAVPPAVCCGTGICGFGQSCFSCPNTGPVCAIPPATCCGDGICGGGLSCAEIDGQAVCTTADGVVLTPAGPAAPPPSGYAATGLGSAIRNGLAPIDPHGTGAFGPGSPHQRALDQFAFPVDETVDARGDDTIQAPPQPTTQMNVAPGLPDKHAWLRYEFHRDDIALMGSGFRHGPGSPFTAHPDAYVRYELDVVKNLPLSGDAEGRVRIFHRTCCTGKQSELEAQEARMRKTSRGGEETLRRDDGEALVVSDYFLDTGVVTGLYHHRDHVIVVRSSALILLKNIFDEEKRRKKLTDSLDELAAWHRTVLPGARKVVDAVIARVDKSDQAEAAPKQGATEARVVSVTGAVELMLDGDESRTRWLAPGDTIGFNDRLYTGMEGEVRLRFPDGAVVLVGELTDVSVRLVKPSTTAIQHNLYVRSGEVTAMTDRSEVKQSDFQIRTPTPSAAHSRWTVFSVAHHSGADPHTVTRTSEGKVLVTGAPGLEAVLVNAGGSATVYPNRIEISGAARLATPDEVAIFLVDLDRDVRIADADRSTDPIRDDGLGVSTGGAGSGTDSRTDSAVCNWSAPARGRTIEGRAVKSIHSVRNTSVADCRAECERRQPDCRSIVYDTKGRWCYLRNSDDANAVKYRLGMEYSACRAGPPTLPPDNPFVQLGPPGTVQTDPIARTRPSCIWAEPLIDRSHDGEILASLRKVSVDQCKVACESNNDCGAISYDRGGRWCYLRLASGNPPLRTRVNLDYYVSNCP